MTLLKVGFVDALYMTIITISTVGYGEVGVMNEAAKLFSILIIFSGLAIVGYGISSILTYFFEGELKESFPVNCPIARGDVLHRHCTFFRYRTQSCHNKREQPRRCNIFTIALTGKTAELRRGCPFVFIYFITDIPDGQMAYLPS